jgi:hypothetical protein
MTSGTFSRSTYSREATTAAEHDPPFVQLLHRGDQVVGVAAVVFDHELDLPPVHAAFLVDLGVPHLGGVHDVEAIGHAAARQGREHAYPDGLVRDARLLLRLGACR